MTITPGELESYRKEWAANRARQMAMTNARRFKAGQFTIHLVRAPDDPGEGELAFQEELSRLGAGLQSAQIPYSQTAIAMDSVDVHGFSLPEFVIAMKALGTPAISAIAGYTAAWIKARKGRRIRIAVGDVEVEASSPDQVERTLQKALELRDRRAADVACLSTSDNTNHLTEGEMNLPIEDDEIRGILLKHFHSLRHSNGGWVPVSETIMTPYPVELGILGGVCQQLEDVGLISWKSLPGENGISAGMARITGKGVAAVESGGSSEISIRFPSSDHSAPRAETNQPQFTSEASGGARRA